MSPALENEKEMLRQIVRGERPLADIRALGMEIESTSDRRVLRMSHPISVRADVHDLAKGFLAYRHDPDKLKEWAFLVEAADLDADVSYHPLGETLQNAVWKASFGEPLEEGIVTAIEQLA